VYFKGENRKDSGAHVNKKLTRNLDHGVGIRLPLSNRVGEGLSVYADSARKSECKSAQEGRARQWTLKKTMVVGAPCHDHIPEQFYCRNCGYVPNWLHRPLEKDASYKVAA